MEDVVVRAVRGPRGVYTKKNVHFGPPGVGLALAGVGKVALARRWNKVASSQGSLLSVCLLALAGVGKVALDWRWNTTTDNDARDKRVFLNRHMGQAHMGQARMGRDQMGQF